VKSRGKQSADFGRLAAFATLAAVLLLRTLAPKKVQDTAALVVGAALLLMLAYYSVRALVGRLSDKTPDSECTLVARAVNPILFYVGNMGIVLGIVSFVLYYTSKTTIADRQLWFGLGLFVFMTGTVCVWFGAYQLKICGQEIRCWSLGGYRAMNLSEVKIARIRIGIDRYRPGIRLEILSRDANKKPVIVALKAFRKNDMDRVFDWLGAKLEDPGELTLTREEPTEDD